MITLHAIFDMQNNHKISKKRMQSSVQIKRGLLIAFEGIDGAGKTTQANNLLRYLIDNKQEEARVYKFPDRETEIGQMIDQHLKGDLEKDD